MKIQIVVFDGVEELDFVGPYEVFQAAREFGADFDVSLVSLEGVRSVTGAFGMRFATTGTLGDPLPQLVIVPGGGWLNRAPQGTWAEIQNKALPEALAALHRKGVPLAAVCTGAFLLSFAGLLNNRRATTHSAAIEDLRSTGVLLTPARVVDEGELITSGGVTAGLDLALHLVERHAGAGFADRVANYLEYARRGPIQ
jgi:transcriptional regulator GlxA family with amidase domain